MTCLQPIQTPDSVSPGINPWVALSGLGTQLVKRHPYCRRPETYVPSDWSYLGSGPDFTVFGVCTLLSGLRGFPVPSFTEHSLSFLFCPIVFFIISRNKLGYKHISSAISSQKSVFGLKFKHLSLDKAKFLLASNALEIHNLKETIRISSVAVPK